MDCTKNNNFMPPPPIRPSPSCSVAQMGQRASTRSGCQNRSTAAAVLDVSTPPPSCAIVQHATLASSISLLSKSQEARAAPPESETRRLNVKSSNSLDLLDEDVPSPKKTLPDFNVRQSGDDSDASGDDSITWEKRKDKVMHLFANQLESENTL